MSAVKKLIARVRGGEGGSLLSEQEAMTVALEGYENTIMELEVQLVDQARSQLQLEAVQKLLAAEQLKSRNLQGALSAYACSIGAVFADVPTIGAGSSSEADAKKTREKDKANAEFESMMAKFSMDTVESDDGDDTAVSPKGLARKGTRRQIDDDDEEAEFSASDAKVEQMKRTIAAMKTALGEMHLEKTSRMEALLDAQGEIQRLQVNVTKSRESLDSERTKRQQLKESSQREIADGKARLVEEEHRNKLQVTRLEDRTSKEIAVLKKAKESLTREVERLSHFEENYNAMEEQLKVAVAEQKNAEQTRIETTKSVEDRYQSLKHHVRRRFTEMSDMIVAALPAHAKVDKVPPPEPPSGFQFLSLKQLEETDLVREIKSVLGMLSYVLTLLQPTLNDDNWVRLNTLRALHQEKMAEMTMKFNELIYQLEERMHEAPVAEVGEAIEEIVARDGALVSEETTVMDDGLADLRSRCDSMTSEAFPEMEEADRQDFSELTLDTAQEAISGAFEGSVSTPHSIGATTPSGTTPTSTTKGGRGATSTSPSRSGRTTSRLPPVDGAGTVMKSPSSSESTPLASSKRSPSSLSFTSSAASPDRAGPTGSTDAADSGSAAAEDHHVPEQQSKARTPRGSETPSGEVSPAAVSGRPQRKRSVSIAEPKRHDEKAAKATPPPSERTSSLPPTPRSAGSATATPASTDVAAAHHHPAEKTPTKRSTSKSKLDRRAPEEDEEATPPSHATSLRSSSVVSHNIPMRSPSSGIMTQPRSSSVVLAQANNVARVAQQHRAVSALADAYVHQQPDLLGYEEAQMQEREDNVSQGVQVLEMAKKLVLHTAGVKALKPIGAIKIDSNSPLGRPVVHFHSKRGVGGATKGKRVFGHPTRRPRQGPPPPVESPKLHVGEGEPKPALPL